MADRPVSTAPLVMQVSCNSSTSGSSLDELTTPAVDVALAAAAAGDYVGPCCWAVDGACGCDRGHAARDVGKAPLTPHGFLDFTRDAETIRAWWAQWPAANVGLDLARSGKA